MRLVEVKIGVFEFGEAITAHQAVRQLLGIPLAQRLTIVVVCWEEIGRVEADMKEIDGEDQADTYATDNNVKGEVDLTKEPEKGEDSDG